MAKRRRIILNDDGEVRIPAEGLAEHSGGTAGEDFLAARFKGSVGTQVDSYFFCVGATDRGPVREGKAITNPQSSMAQFFYYGEEGRIHPATDEATRLLIERAHDAGMEMFASVRLNDCHDSNDVREKGWNGLSYPLKIQRPDLLLGQKHPEGRYPHLLEGEEGDGSKGYPMDSVMSWFFAGFDYAREEVRQHFLDFILGYCRQYDYEGVELDYGRGPLYFRFGEECQNLDTMTGFVRQVRQGLDEIGRERGKPYLLAARAMATVEQSRRAGLDVERWLAEGLLDLLVIGSGNSPYWSAPGALIDMAHRYGVPAYPCINHMISTDGTSREPVELRGMASNFWALGGDGVYIFNYFGVPEGSEQQQCLRQMGDPDALRGLDKEYHAEQGFTWFPYGYEVVPSQFPVGLIYGTPIELVVGDDVQEAAREGLLAEACLLVRVGNLDESEGITVIVNRDPVPTTAVKRTAKDSFEAALQAPPLRRGSNEVVVLPGPNSVGRVSNTHEKSMGQFASTVEGLQLSVRYKHD